MRRQLFGVIGFTVTALATGICLNFLFMSVSALCETPGSNIPYYRSYGNFWAILDSHFIGSKRDNYIYYPTLLLNSVILGVPSCLVVLSFINWLVPRTRASIAVVAAASLPPIVVSVFILTVALTHRTHGYVGSWSWPSLPKWAEAASCTRTVDRKNWFIFRGTPL